MARRRHQSAPEPALRAHLAAEYRAEDASHPERVDAGYGDGSFFLSPWRLLADRLEAGEPVDVYGWELKQWVPEVESSSRYRVEADGYLTHLSWRGRIG